jgi:hypothetical protein
MQDAKERCKASRKQEEQPGQRAVTGGKNRRFGKER